MGSSLAPEGHQQEGSPRAHDVESLERHQGRALWRDDVLRDVLAASVGVDGAIARLARAQHGAVSRVQLAAIGMSAGQLRSRVARSLLHPVHRGVYLVGHTAPAPFGEEMAAVLACGPRVLLSHRSAGYVWALLPKPTGAVHVTGPALRPRAGIRLHRSALSASDIGRCRGIPITSPARTVVDLGAELDPLQHENVAAEAIRRRLVRRRELLEAAERAGRRPGAAQTRRLMTAQHNPALTRSRAERRLLQLVRAAGLPEPDCNVALGRNVPDFLWPAQRLIVETDGFEFHSSRTAFESDRARDAERQAHGYRVLRFTWRQLDEQPERVVALLAQILATPGSAACS